MQTEFAYIFGDKRDGMIYVPHMGSVHTDATFVY
jgi:hypothetical protein